MTRDILVQDSVFKTRIIAYLRAILGGFAEQTYKGASRPHPTWPIVSTSASNMNFVVVSRNIKGTTDNREWVA